MTGNRDLHFEKDAPSHELGQYCAWSLPADANAPIDLLWLSVADPVAPAAHRVLPHGEPSIAVRRRFDRHGDVSACDLVICGPHSTALWYRPEPAEELIAVRLKPELSADIFGVDPAEVYDAPAAPVSRRLERLCDSALAGAATQMPRMIAALLMKDIRRAAGASATRLAPETFAAQLLRSSNGAWRTGDLAQALNISERHLRRRFRERMGCSLKMYSRQLRLTATIQAAEKMSRPNWADLAAANGFHDQAHLINEARALLAATPGRIHRERRALAGFSNTHAT